MVRTLASVTTVRTALEFTCTNCGGSDKTAIVAAVIAAVTAVITVGLAVATFRMATATRDAAEAGAEQATATRANADASLKLLDETRKANALPGYLDFFREYRLCEPDRRYVLLRLRNHERQRGISGLPEKAHGHAVNVCHYLDHLGFLVANQIIELDAVDRLMGRSVLVCWQALAPYIERERKVRASDYAGYFEQLAAQLLDRQGHEDEKPLQRVPADAALPIAVQPNFQRPADEGQ